MDKFIGDRMKKSQSAPFTVEDRRVINVAAIQRALGFRFHQPA